MVTPITFTGKAMPVSQNKKAKVEKTSIPENNSSKSAPSINKLNSSLLALAVIGASVLQSCSQDDIYDTYQPPTQTTVEQEPFKYLSTAKKLDLLMKTLDLQTQDESISNYDNVSISDGNGTKISYEPTEVGKQYLTIVDRDDKRYLTIKKDTVRMKEQKVGPELFEESMLKASSKPDSLFIDREGGNVIDRKLYTMNAANDTINEFKYDNGFYIETSKLTKNPEGGFRQILPDGTVRVFTRANND